MRTETNQAPPQEMRKCERCGVEYTLKPWDRGRIFCGDRCRKRDEREFPGR